MKKNLLVLSGFALALMLIVSPSMVVFAQGGATPTAPVVVGQTTQKCDANAPITNIEQLFCRISSILNSIIPVLVALGVVYFVYGVVTYVISNDEEAKKKGRDRIIYGIIGLAVIISMWGLVNLLTGSFAFTGSSALPKVPGV